MTHKIYLIVAADLKGGIGIDGKLPWDLKGDMDFFRKVTIKTDDCQDRNMVVMGRKTWESIPEKHRPLAGRKNVVLSSDKELKLDGAEVVSSLEAAFKLADERVADIFIIGGGKVFEQALKTKKLDGLYLTRVQKEYKCDTFMPKGNPFNKVEKLGGGEEDGVSYEFTLHTKEKQRGGGGRPGRPGRPGKSGRSGKSGKPRRKDRR